MRLVVLNEYWWSKYQEICQHRDLVVPWPSRTAILAAEGKELVAGVMAYDTSGPHVFFEHLVTNETAILGVRHAAVKLMAEEMVRYCRTSGKIPHILVRHLGIANILASVGLQPSGAWSMTCKVEDLDGKEEENAAPGNSRRGRSRPATLAEVAGGDPTYGA